MNSRVLLSKFPSFVKPSYETFVHNRVDDNYDIAVAIPNGKRAFIWFTFIENENICCIIEVGRCVICILLSSTCSTSTIAIVTL